MQAHPRQAAVHCCILVCLQDGPAWEVGRQGRIMGIPGRGCPGPLPSIHTHPGACRDFDCGQINACGTTTACGLPTKRRGVGGTCGSCPTASGRCDNHCNGAFQSHVSMPTTESGFCVRIATMCVCGAWLQRPWAGTHAAVKDRMLQIGTLVTTCLLQPPSTACLPARSARKHCTAGQNQFRHAFPGLQTEMRGSITFTLLALLGAALVSAGRLGVRMHGNTQRPRAVRASPNCSAYS